MKDTREMLKYTLGLVGTMVQADKDREDELVAEDVQRELMH